MKYKIIIQQFKDHNLGYITLRRSYDFYTDEIIDFENSLEIFNTIKSIK